MIFYIKQIFFTQKSLKLLVGKKFYWKISHLLQPSFDDAESHKLEQFHFQRSASQLE